jgi:hypothetical protein
MPESSYSIVSAISVGSMNASFVTWNSTTAQNTVASLVSNDISYNTLNISLSSTTTITGGVVTFQGSFDGVAFFNMTGFIPGTSTTIGPTYTLLANTYAVFQFNLTAIPYFQILLGTAITGTGAVTIGFAADSFVGSSVNVAGTVSISGTVAVSGTVAATQSGTWNVTINTPLPAGTNVIGHVITDSGSTTVVTGTVAVTQSTSPWVVSLASTTITGTVAVTQSTSPWVVAGNLTHNNAAPAATNIGVLPAVASAGAPSYTAADQVLLSTDLSGNLRVVGSFSAGALPDLVGSTAALNALNAVASINAFGYDSVGMFLAAGTLVGTIVPEVSLDGGTTWVSTFFDDPVTGNVVSSIVFGSANTATTRAILGAGGGSNYRVRVSAFTSGTANATLRANDITNPTLLNAGAAGAALPPVVAQVGGSVTTAAPTYVTDTVNALSLDTSGQLRVSVTGTNLVTQGTSPWVVSLTSTAITGTVAVTQSTSPWVVAGNLTNNNAAPAANNVGVLSAIAETAYATVTYTTGDMVLPVTDLHGALNHDLQAVGGTAVVTAVAGVQKVGVVGNAGAAFDVASSQNQPTPANMLLVGGEFNTIPTTIASGNSSPLQLDALGALKEAGSGTSNTSAASWTSATALNTAVTLVSANFSYNSLLLTINQTTTLTGGVVSFEASNDNVNWFAASGVNYVTDGTDVQSYAFQASTYAVYKFNIGTHQYFRVRLSTVITGTGTVTIGYATSSNGVPLTKVQPLKDSGRTFINIVADNINGITTEALITFQVLKGLTLQGAGTTYTVSAGKTLRVTAFYCDVGQTTAALATARARLRVASSGVSVTSPIAIPLHTSSLGAINTYPVPHTVAIPDGAEFASGTQLAISVICNTTSSQLNIGLIGFEY